MKSNLSATLSVVALVLLAVAQFLTYPDSGWNAGILLLGGLLVTLNLGSFLKRS